MGRLANGTVTGQLDSRFESIRVGDTVKCLADGLEYVVDGFGGIRNESGAAFKLKEWKPSEFIIVEPKATRKAAEPERAAEPETRAEQPPVAVTISPTLEDYSDERLRAELERRGFAGTLTKVVTLTLGA